MQGIPAILVHGGAGRIAAGIREEQRSGLLQSVQRGWAVLSSGGSALDAVVAAVSEMESEPVFNAGVGSVLTSAGTVEMDASVMEGSALRAGAVGVVWGVTHPVQLARAILERSPHLLLVGDAAREHAAQWGLELCPRDALVTPRQLQRWQAGSNEEGCTVGAVALDVRGTVAAATSTGGMFRKWPGRIGDSAVIGAGTYADDLSGAASATGHGEAIIRLSLAHSTTAMLRNGVAPQRAAARAIADLAGRAGGEGGIIVVDVLGRVGWASNAEHMGIAYRLGDRDAEVANVEEIASV